MDANVKLMKELLEAGYKITSQTMEFQKSESGEDISTDTIKLEKGSDTRIITSTNSIEFFEYIKHFKKIKDQYNNIEFVYIEDLGEFNKQLLQQRDQIWLKEKHLLNISGREFSESIITIQFKPSGPGNNKGLAAFMIDLNKNQDFELVDLRDEVTVYENKNLVFRGLVKEFERDSKETGYLFLQDMSLKMESERVSAEFNKMNPTDCVGIMSESAGFKFAPSGVPYNTTERPFIIIVPIENLIISDYFLIGDVEFYQEFNTIDDEHIRKSKIGRTDKVWNGNFPRAKITINAKQFYEAINKGYQKISQAIDIIALRTDISSPSIKLGNDKKNLRFEFYKIKSKVKIPTWVYCREENTKAHAFFNIEFLSDTVLSLDLHPDKYFKTIGNIFEDILKKKEEELGRDERNSLVVLHWLRRAIQNGNPKDKLLDLWTAIEFLVSGIKLGKQFSKGEIHKLKEKISEDTELSDNKKNAISGKYNMLNDPPLLKKIEFLASKTNNQFSEEENNILKKTRNKRNNLIHGRKDIDVEENELSKLRTIIEKLLIGKVLQLKVIDNIIYLPYIPPKN